MSSILKLYRGIREPKIGTGTWNKGQEELLSALPRRTDANHALNMVKGSGWWTTNPRTASTYTWNNGGSRSVIVPADLVVEPDLTLDAGGAFWNEFYPGNRKFLKAIKDKDVKAVRVNNVVDSGGQTWDYIDDLQALDMPMGDAMRHLFIGDNVLVKDPSILRYLDKTPVRYGGGGAVLGGLMKMAREAAATKSADPRMNTFAAARRLYESALDAPKAADHIAPKITDFIPEDELKNLDPVERLRALRAMGFDITRPQFMSSQRKPEGYEYLETSPMLAEMGKLGSGERRLIYGNFTPEEIKNSYPGRSLYKDRRNSPRYNDEIEQLRKFKDQLGEWAKYDAELGATYPVFVPKEYFDYGYHLPSLGSGFDSQRMVPVFGGPLDVGKFSKGGLAALSGKRYGVGGAVRKTALDILSPIRPQRLQIPDSLVGRTAALRGGKQPVAQLLAQLKGQPGVSPAAVASGFGHLPAAAKMSPQELADAMKPQELFAQRGRAASRWTEDAAMELAVDLMWSDELAPYRQRTFEQLLQETLASDLAPASADRIEALLRVPSHQRKIGWENQARSAISDLHPDVLRRGDAGLMGGVMSAPRGEPSVMDRAMDLARERSPQPGFNPAFGTFQRQPEAKALQAAGGNYFETVLRGAPSRASELPGHDSYHFQNPAQLGYARGTLSPSGQRLLLEEIQSDPLEILGERNPAMKGIYGALGKMMLERAAHANVPLVQFPSASRIGAVRGGEKPFMQDIYDRTLSKELFTPLQDAGVPLYSFEGWTTVEMPEALREAIRSGKGPLQRKTGGAV